MNLKSTSIVAALCALVVALGILPFATFGQTVTPAQGSRAPQASTAGGTTAGAQTNQQGGMAALPGIDKILDKYIEASGGRVAWQKLNSRESKGVVDVPAMNASGSVEVYEKAPSKVLVTITISGATFSQGYDGKVGWSSDPQNGLREQTGDELAETQRDADFYLPLDMRTMYSKFNVTGTEDVNGHRAYAVEATPPEGGDPDKLYFATDTGLLVRTISQRHTPDGVFAIQEDFSDYRQVDGITVPFQTRTSGQLDFTIRLEEMHHNVAIDNAKFEKPAAQ